MAAYYKDVTNRAIAELQGPLDAAAHFRGSKSEKEKQDAMDKLVEAYNGIVSPLRGLGFNFGIGRSYSEGAANHGTSYALDLVPPSRSLNDAYSLAEAAANLEVCEQVWIEASDDSGNFHVHVKYDTSGKNSSPDLKTIMSRDGSSVQDGLVHSQEKVEGAVANVY